MNTNLTQVLSELPAELQNDVPPQRGISELLVEKTAQAIPAGRWSRFWTLGTLQGKIAAAYTFWWMRGMWQGADAKQSALNETHLRAAAELVGTMSYLRGPVMKLGQTLSHWPGLAPREFADLLASLQFQAPPMHFSLLKEYVQNELGRKIEDVFEHFEPRAAAAASLGQVHRARLKGSGIEVAVKIQYPGIARAIAADVANIKVLFAPMRLGQDGESLFDQLDDIEAMLLLETDFVKEAENLATARKVLQGIEGVFVPRVYAECSNERILTMDWVEGVHLEEFEASDPSQSERDRYGSLLSRAILRMCYKSHMMYADPHPGNVVFMRDGRLGLIDFGCVRRYSADEVDYMIEGELAGYTSREAVRKALVRGADLTPSQAKDEARMALMTEWYDWICKPNMAEGVFDFGDEAYIRRGMELFGELMKRRYTRTLPLNTWVTRGFVGVRALLYRMKARVEFSRIMGEETTVERPGK